MQPLASVEWVDPAKLRANDYNPNRVAKIELQLLKLSIMENGWTQPIVARDDGEIVDGFHRWTLGSKDKDVRGLADGKVPVVRIRSGLSKADQMLATIRHNRARGSHIVLKMADIVAALVKSGMKEADIMRRLGMEQEEVERLRDARGMPVRAGKGKFTQAWEPV